MREKYCSIWKHCSAKQCPCECVPQPQPQPSIPASRTRPLSSAHHIHLTQMCLDTIPLLGPVACFASLYCPTAHLCWLCKADAVMVLFPLGVSLWSWWGPTSVSDYPSDLLLGNVCAHCCPSVSASLWLLIPGVYVRCVLNSGRALLHPSLKCI